MKNEKQIISAYDKIMKPLTRREKFEFHACAIHILMNLIRECNGTATALSIIQETMADIKDEENKKTR